MDLVDFDRDVFEGIATDFSTLLEGRSLYPIPVSALHGDNVITRSDRTPWFDGPSLLEYLETVEIARTAANGAFRFPVQLVLRPDQDFRGYAGQILSGTVRVGDTVTAWPSVRSSRVRRIVTWDGELDVAFAPMSVTLVLENELDVSRGDIIVNSPIHMGKRFKADVVWMDERPLEPNRLYVHQTRVGDDHGPGGHATAPERHQPHHDRDLARAGLRQYSRAPRHGQLHPDRADDELHRRRGNDRGAPSGRGTRSASRRGGTARPPRAHGVVGG